MIDVSVAGESALAPGAVPLRYGVIIDRDTLPAWQRAVIDQLAEGGDAVLALLLRGEEVNPPDRAAREDSLWRLYNNGLVARRARCVERAGSWRDVAPSVPIMRIRVARRGKWSQYVEEDDLARVVDVRLDFVLRFGLGIIRGALLDAARYGVWSFHHDDERVIRGGPPAFWEVNDGLATSGVVLQRLTDRLDGGVPLARATFRSVLHSYPRNRDRIFLGAAGLPAQVARAVRIGALDPCAIAVSPSTAPIRRNPTNREMGRFLARQFGRAISTRARGVFRADRWTVGTAQRPTQMTPNGELTVGAVQWLPERAEDGYFADPFPAQRDGRTAILVEEFDERENRGVISALEQCGSRWEVRSAVIDPGVHASYPFVMSNGGELYCIPETAQAGGVDIWRCIEFPTRWVRVQRLVDGVALVDPTIFTLGEQWWLVGTLKDDEPDTKLHAWSAPALFGPWTPHPLNPVKIDVCSSRPAGTPFRLDGDLYRPAQDCSTAYGAAVVCNRVVSLDERGLVEEPVGRLRAVPGRYASGSHTLSSWNGLWVVDGRRYAHSRYRMTRELAARVRRLTQRRTSTSIAG